MRNWGHEYMAFKIYKMSFHRAHFGKGYLNSSGMLFDASRLYSALCLEAIKNDCLDEFINLSFKDDFYLICFLTNPLAIPNLIIWSGK